MTSTLEQGGNAFERFIASGAGRAAKVTLGTGLIGLGLAVVGGPAGFAMAAFGVVPVIAGAANLCPIAPLWGGHFFGADYCRPKR